MLTTSLEVERDRRSGRNLRSRILQGPTVRFADERRESGVERPGIPAFTRTIFPSSSPATGRARPSTPILAAGHGASMSRALAGIVTPGNHLIGDGGMPIAGFRPPRRHSLPRRALAGQANPRGAPPPHQQRQRLPQPPQAMAQPLQRRRHQKPAQLSRLAQSPRSLGDNLDPPKWISAPSETDHTNR